MKTRLAASLFTLFCLFGAAQARAAYTAWPFNGRVINQSTASVEAWDGEHDFYRIGGGEMTSNLRDVDHIRVADSVGWCKLGANVVTVAPSGQVSGCECWVGAAAEPCEAQDQHSLIERVASALLGRDRVRTVVAYLSSPRTVLAKASV
ncbi:hypothetical protein [Jeongeupia naejangsanensis]|uniref:Uncharacterized protein n=1 Tax=Jeongeupia naejangsanensis TaxID=613195 RepID=A0ABS2BJ29_9NEIS|nr:hypothetical protein [Jeongeupia naejangsanensis]MBM3115617.1 hypothetical protein [Jeongeupia naejangsanensis]